MRGRMMIGGGQDDMRGGMMIGGGRDDMRGCLGGTEAKKGCGHTETCLSDVRRRAQLDHLGRISDCLREEEYDLS